MENGIDNTIALANNMSYDVIECGEAISSTLQNLIKTIKVYDKNQKALISLLVKTTRENKKLRKALEEGAF